MRQRSAEIRANETEDHEQQLVATCRLKPLQERKRFEMCLMTHLDEAIQEQS